jgi:hypothetical protein
MHKVYERPAVTRFGTFRELTRFGPDSGGDVGSVFGIAGCSAENTGNEFGCAVDPAGSR